MIFGNSNLVDKERVKGQRKLTVLPYHRYLLVFWRFDLSRFIRLGSRDLLLFLWAAPLHTDVVHECES